MIIFWFIFYHVTDLFLIIILNNLTFIKIIFPLWIWPSQSVFKRLCVFYNQLQSQYRTGTMNIISYFFHVQCYKTNDLNIREIKPRNLWRFTLIFLNIWLRSQKMFLNIHQYNKYFSKLYLRFMMQQFLSVINFL